MKTEVKVKTLIKKIDATTVEVNGQKLSLDDKTIFKLAGADYFVYEQNGNYFISPNDSKIDAAMVSRNIIPTLFQCTA